MKIGIVVYSQTGNTLSVAKALQEQLAQKGHAVTIEKITTKGTPSPGNKEIEFEKLPDLGSYEALVLAAPVQAFSLCAAMSAYLPQLPSLSGKKVALFTTKSFSSDWTGGSKAIATMTKAVEVKGGVVCGSGTVHWKKKDEEMASLMEKLGCLFG